MISAPIIAPENASLAAGKTAASDDDGGDDVELGTVRHRRITLPQTRHLHHAGKTEEEAGERVRRDLETRRIDAARARRRFVRPQREDPPAEHRARQHDGDKYRQRDGDPHAERKHEPDRLGKRDEQAIHPRGWHIDCLLMCGPLRQAAGDAEHAERDDERHDAKCRDEQAVREANGSAGKHARRDCERRRPAVGQSERREHTGERDGRADREVDSAADDDHRHADGAERDDDRLRKDDAEVERRQIPRRRRCEDRKDDDDEGESEGRAEAPDAGMQQRRGSGKPCPARAAAHVDVAGQ